jgi:hypothetical protein
MPGDVNRINYKWNKFVESKNETPEQKSEKRRLLKLNFNFDGNFIHVDSQDLDSNMTRTHFKGVLTHFATKYHKS